MDYQKETQNCGCAVVIPAAGKPERGPGQQHNHRNCHESYHCSATDNIDRRQGNDLGKKAAKSE